MKPTEHINRNNDKYFIKRYKNIDNKLKDANSRRLGISFYLEGTGFSLLKDFKHLKRTSASSKLNPTYQLKLTPEERSQDIGI